MLNILKLILNGVFFISSANILNSMIGVLSTVLITRFLLPDEYGNILIMIALCGVLESWTGLGMEDFLSADIAREYGEGRITSGQLLAKNFAITKIGLTCLLVLIIIVIYLVFPNYLDSKFSSLWYGLLFLPFVSAISAIMIVTLSALRQFKTLAIMSTLSELLRLLGNGLLFFPIFRFSLYILIVHALSILIPPVFIIALEGGRLFRISDHNKISEGFKLWTIFKKHGKWSFALRIIKRLTEPLPILILGHLSGKDVVAYYNIAAKFVSLLQSPISSLESVLKPVFASSLNAIDEISNRIRRYALYFSIFLAGIGVLSAKTLITLLFSEQYIRSIVIAYLLIPAIISLGLRSCQRSVFFALQRQNIVFFYYSANIIMELILILVFTVLWEEKGFAVARILSTFILFFLYEIKLRQLEIKREPIYNLLIFDSMDKNIIINFIQRIRKTVIR